jgi:hypothetical protein
VAEEEAQMVDEGLAADEDVVEVEVRELLLRQLPLFLSKFKNNLERDILATVMIKDLKKIKAGMIDKIQARWSECIRSVDNSRTRSGSQNYTSRYQQAQWIIGLR